MAVAREIMVAVLALLALGRCACTGDAVACRDERQCPRGFRCDPGQGVCVWADGGQHASDAAASDGARLDVEPRDAAPADQVATGDRGEDRDAMAPQDATAAPDASAVDGPLPNVVAAWEASLTDHGAADAIVADRIAAVDHLAVDTAPDPDAWTPDLAPAPDVAGPPLIVTVTPRDGASAVDVGTSVQLDFSRPMDPESVAQGGVCVAPLAGGCVAGNVSWLHQASAVFTPTAPLAGSTIHVVTVRASCRDSDGQAFAGSGGADCQAPEQCTRFTTSDGTPPTVASVVPADGATGVARAPTVTLTFAEPMDQDSVAAHVKSGGGELAGSWAWVSGTAYRFTAAISLGCSELVRVSVDEGARDPSGLALVDTCSSVAGAAFCSSFTTRPTQEVCRTEPDGTCSDVLTLREACCGGCAQSVSVSCVNVGNEYTVSCGTGCTTGCHYRRVEDTHQVCIVVCP